jgi:hypothetical protein
VSVFISDSFCNNFSVSSNLEIFDICPSFAYRWQKGFEAFLSQENSVPFMEKERIQFPEGNQKKFIAKAKELSGKSWRKAPELFGIKYNTLQGYWKELTRLSKKDFNKICIALRLNAKKVIEKYNAVEYYWDYEKQIVEAGYANFGKIKKNTAPSKITFSNECLELDCSGVIFSNFDLKKKIVLPNKITPLLAEEIGLSIGDGYISNCKYEYRLKGNKANEKEYYGDFVKPMFKNLYNIDVKIMEYETTVGFENYSRALWEFKTKVIGLPWAPKVNVRVPDKLKINNGEILCSLIRGLFDTDGMFYFHSQSRNKSYYPVISYSSISKKLCEDIFEILKMLGFNPFFFEDNKKYANRSKPVYVVMLNGYSNFELYKKLINTRQPKNINKLKAWEQRFGK